MAFPPEPRTRAGKVVMAAMGMGLFLWSSVDAARQVHRNSQPMDPEQVAALADTVTQTREDHTRNQALSTIRFAAAASSTPDNDKDNGIA